MYSSKLTKTSASIFLVILVMTSLPEKTSSAPATILKIQTNGTFMGDLLSYVKTHSCPFPIPSDFEQNLILQAKVDHICNGSGGKEVFINGTIKPNVSTFMCVAFADYVMKICSKSKEFEELLVQQTQRDFSIALDIESSIEIPSFCNKLLMNGPRKEELRIEIQDFYADLISPVQNHEQSCVSVCKNKPIPTMEGIQEGSKINPLCILFMKEVELLKKVEDPKQPKKQQVISMEGIKDTTKNDKKTSSIKSPPISSSLTLNKESSVSLSSVGVSPPLMAEDPMKEEPQDLNKPSKKPEQGKISHVPSSSLVDYLQKDKSPHHNDLFHSSEKIISGVPLLSSDKLIPDLDAKSEVPNAAKIDSTFSKPSTSSTTSTSSSLDTAQLNGAADDMPLPPPGDSPSGTAKEQQVGQQESPQQVLSKPTKNEDNNKAKVSSSSSFPTKPSPSADQNNKQVKNEIEKIQQNQEENDYKGSSGEDLDPEIEANNNNNNNKDNQLENIPESNPNAIKKQPFKNQGGKGNENNDIFPNGKLQEERTDMILQNVEIEQDGGGYFNYFIFFITFLALCFFVFHNKRRILAFALEGRKPRGGAGGGRSRRRSAQIYSRLENNFE